MENQTKDLEKIANKIRQLIIISLLHAGSGHAAGSLGMADIFTYLYFKFLRIFPQDPWNEKRDRFYLSNGHICPVWYATLAVRGFFSVKELTGLRDINSKLEGHPIYRSLPGIENTSGSLGQGISQAVGAAMGLKDRYNKIICIIGDGEIDEGQVWEAMMFLGNSNLKNITIIVDRNNIQQSENTESIMPLEPLQQKLEAFNLVTFQINGHDFNEINDVMKKIEIIERPTIIVANTIPGKGVSFMENDYTWHSKAPSKEEAKLAIEELKNL